MRSGKDSRQKTAKVSGSKHLESTPPVSSTLNGPRAVIARRAADRLRAGHVWVYASDIEEVSLSSDEEPPSLLPVVDSRGILLGTALYSPSSQIALRLISTELVEETE